MRVGVVALVLLLLLILAVREPLSARLTGEEVRLRVALLDPIDPFRGAYVVLAYPDLPGLTPFAQEPGESPATTPNGDVYVPLVRESDIWVGKEPLPDPPGSGPYLACSSDGYHLDCGIESYFLPQRQAAAMEKRLRDQEVVATVRVDAAGHAALMGLSR